MISNESSSGYLTNALRLLTVQAEQARKNAESYLAGNMFNHVWIWLQAKASILPLWAEHHIQATKELKKMIFQFQKEGRQIPPDSVKTLKDCRQVLGALAARVEQIKLTELLQIERAANPGSSGLLTSAAVKRPLPPFNFEWQLNLGLMLNAHHQAGSATLKKEISFLILNYLAKAAPIAFDRLKYFVKDSEGLQELKNKQHLGYFNQHGYHREQNFLEDVFSQKLAGHFAKATAHGMAYMLDTCAIKELFPLKFYPIDLTRQDGVDQLMRVLLDPANQKGLSKPLMMDLTPQLGKTIQTHGEEEKERLFNLQFKILGECFEKMIGEAVRNVKSNSTEEAEKYIQNVKEHLLCICLLPIQGAAVLKVIPLFKDISGTIVSFLNLTGLRMGGVSTRQHLFDFIDLEELLARSNLPLMEYAVPGAQDAIYFPSLSEIPRLEVFKRLEKHHEANPSSPAAILGKPTLLVLRGALEAIGLEKWEALNRQPDGLDETTRQDLLAKKMLLQTTLYRLTQNLARAENNVHDFGKFAEAIELMHCEIATLLKLTNPFKPENFTRIYSQQLTRVPLALRNYCAAGITKSAMNTFAGICSAVLEKDPSDLIVHGRDSYFEEELLAGKNRSIDMVLSKPSAKAALYFGEFNHNINSRLDYNHYQPGDVIGDIEKLFRDRAAPHLTVAIDSTIELADSPRVEALLHRFAKEIEEGRLNVIFFRSGQKFEMLGMDNYYGAPFFMINNGGKQWEAFDRLNRNPAFQTDELSVQWFCLVNQAAPKELDDYRATIFANSRRILDRVPKALQSEGSSVRVSTVDPAMDAAFIDIKILDQSKIARHIIENMFYDKMIAHGRKAHSRGSFGFYHPNFNFLDDATIRINPGLDPVDNGIILEVLNEIVKFLA